VKKKKPNWKVDTTDVGQKVLRWKVGRDAMVREEHDPLAQTYNFLRRLDLENLILEEEAKQHQAYDPYSNTGVLSSRPRRSDSDE
jgi:hypothetical protein